MDNICSDWQGALAAVVGLSEQEQQEQDPRTLTPHSQNMLQMRTPERERENYAEKGGNPFLHMLRERAALT